MKYSVGIIGCGGIGARIALELPRYPEIERVILFDHDVYEEGNQLRQPLWEEGKAKVAVIKKHIKGRVPTVIAKQEAVVSGPQMEARSSSKAGLLTVYLCCTDTLASRTNISQIAEVYKHPVIFGGNEDNNGSVFLYLPGEAPFHAVYKEATAERDKVVQHCTAQNAPINAQVAHSMLYALNWFLKTEGGKRERKFPQMCNIEIDRRGGVMVTPVWAVKGKEERRWRSERSARCP